MSNLIHGIDHFVYATPDLEQTVVRITQATGVTAVFGGEHDIGTQNYLLSLTHQGQRSGTYLEIIGVSADRAEPIEQDFFGLQTATSPYASTFCIPLDRDGSAPAASQVAEAINEYAGTRRSVNPQERRTASGELLTWLLLPPQAGVGVNPVPFAISWGATAHPAETTGPSLELKRAAVQSTDPIGLTRLYRDLGITVPVTTGQPHISLTLNGPNGAITL